MALQRAVLTWRAREMVSRAGRTAQRDGRTAEGIVRGTSPRGETQFSAPVKTYRERALPLGIQRFTHPFTPRAA